MLVELSVFVVDINSINVEDMDFRVDMFVHQKWKESRLTLSDDLFEDGDDFVTLPPEFIDNFLWQPDPYFLNSKVAGERLKHEIFYFLNAYSRKSLREQLQRIKIGNSYRN